MPKTKRKTRCRVVFVLIVEEVAVARVLSILILSREAMSAAMSASAIASAYSQNTRLTDCLSHRFTSLESGSCCVVIRPLDSANDGSRNTVMLTVESMSVYWWDNYLRRHDDDGASHVRVARGVHVRLIRVSLPYVMRILAEAGALISKLILCGENGAVIAAACFVVPEYRTVCFSKDLCVSVCVSTCDDLVNHIDDMLLWRAQTLRFQTQSHPQAFFSKCVSALPECAELRKLAFTFSALQDADLALLADVLPRCLHLRSIDLSGNCFTADGLMVLADKLANTCIHTVKVAHSIHEKESVFALVRALHACPSVHSFRMYIAFSAANHADFSRSEADTLANSIRKTSLHTFHVYVRGYERNVAASWRYRQLTNVDEIVQTIAAMQSTAQEADKRELENAVAVEIAETVQTGDFLSPRWLATQLQRLVQRAPGHAKSVLQMLHAYWKLGNKNEFRQVWLAAAARAAACLTQSSHPAASDVMRDWCLPPARCLSTSYVCQPPVDAVCSFADDDAGATHVVDAAASPVLCEMLRASADSSAADGRCVFIPFSREDVCEVLSAARTLRFAQAKAAVMLRRVEVANFLRVMPFIDTVLPLLLRSHVFFACTGRHVHSKES